MPNRAWEHFHESSNHDSWTALTSMPRLHYDTSTVWSIRCLMQATPVQGTYTSVLSHFREAHAVLVNRIATAALAVGKAMSAATDIDTLMLLCYQEDVALQYTVSNLSTLRLALASTSGLPLRICKAPMCSSTRDIFATITAWNEAYIMLVSCIDYALDMTCIQSVSQCFIVGGIL